MRSHVDVSADYNVDTWADVEFVTCHSQIRVPGLATEIIRNGVSILKERGVKVSNMI